MTALLDRTHNHARLRPTTVGTWLSVLVSVAVATGCRADDATEAEPKTASSAAQLECQEGGCQSDLRPQMSGIEALEEESQRELEIRFGEAPGPFAEVPHSARFEVPLAEPYGDAVSNGWAFLERFKDLYRLGSPMHQLYVQRVSRGPTTSHVFFGQQFHGRPVFGAWLAVHMDNKAVLSTSGRYLTSAPLETTPDVTADQAILAARSVVAPRASEELGTPILVYLNRSLFGDEDSETRLAWLVSLSASDEEQGTSTQLSFVDARTRKILNSWSTDRKADFEIWDANGGSMALRCSSPSWTLSYTEAGLVSGVMPSPDATEGFDSAVRTLSVLGAAPFNLTNGWDGTDAFEATVNGGGANALYRPRCNEIFFSAGYAVADVFAHEFGHGIMAFSSGFIYRNESGALDESFADIMGAIVDDDDWQIGEDTPGGAIRSLADPPSHSDLGFAHPDHIDDFVRTSDDFGGVHINNGITNKAFYLAAAGGSHRGRWVSGIGRSRAGSIFFDAFRNRLGPSSTLADARDAAKDEVEQKYRDGVPGFGYGAVCSIVNAFAAVGLGDDCATSYVDSDRDRRPDLFDNCPDDPNPGQRDTDGDGQGDACDDDDDNDGAPDGDDNCPLTPNDTQDDWDEDGRGDACDDTDGDGVLDAADNCDVNPNPEQRDFDGDSKGDVCDEDVDGDGVWEDGDGSGVRGDNPCVDGQREDCDDNCPYAADNGPNGDQSDGDGDLVGDVCDTCEGLDSREERDLDGDGIPDRVYVWISDNDGDGLGDLCDPDDDNDGILDVDDNCQFRANPRQIDIDRDGTGSLCDPDEPWNYWGDHFYLGFFDFRDMWQVPLDLCFADGCPDWLRTPSTIQVRLRVEIPVFVRVLDERGLAVGRRLIEEGEQVVSFKTPGGFAGAGNELKFNAKAYRLAIEPLQSFDGEVPIEIGLFADFEPNQ